VKLVVFGGGSSYTPLLIDGTIRNLGVLPITEVCLTDLNQHRLEIMAGLARRMIARAGVPLSVTMTKDRRRALEGAAFVNSLIRVGGMDARINDEKIPLKYGIIGQETTGPGGMMKALRTIPVILQLADEMVELCPDAWLINYTNPSGVIAEALGKYCGVRFVGLCSGPKGWIETILGLMGADPRRANVDWIGLNHLGFATRVWLDGKDVTEQAIEAVANSWQIDGQLMRVLGAIPCGYLRYYYHRDLMVQQATETGYRTRGEFVKEIESKLLEACSDPTLHEVPALVHERGGRGYAGVAFEAMVAIYNNTGQRQVVQVINRGAVDGIPEDASVEAACLVDASGAHPIRIGALPLPVRGLVQAVKAYESLTVEAAVEGSKRIAMQALMAHPLVPSWEIARPLMDDLLAANRAWIDWVS
jgi:6-phospho-beta-glucosidase